MPITYTAIQTTTVGAGGSGNIQFNSIPQTYTDLVLRLSCRASTAANWILIGINGGSDTATTLRHALNFSGTLYGQTYSSFRTPCALSTHSNVFSGNEVYIPNYTDTSYNRCMLGYGVQPIVSTDYEVQLATYQWNTLGAITSLTLTVDGGGNFTQYSTASLYGIKKN
jgi:hypothetical protein